MHRCEHVCVCVCVSLRLHAITPVCLLAKSNSTPPKTTQPAATAPSSSSTPRTLRLDPGGSAGESSDPQSTGRRSSRCIPFQSTTGAGAGVSVIVWAHVGACRGDVTGLHHWHRTIMGHKQGAVAATVSSARSKAGGSNGGSPSSVYTSPVPRTSITETVRV